MWEGYCDNDYCDFNHSLECNLASFNSQNVLFDRVQEQTRTDKSGGRVGVKRWEQHTSGRDFHIL